jgi:enoyl-CoA hydratase/carnithine racemase
MIAIFQEILAPAAFREMALTGKRYTGPEAKALGFIDEVYEKDELVPKSIEFAKFLTTKNLSAYAEIKRRIRAETIRIIKEEDPKYITGGTAKK